jgi:hypothetical protein
MKIIIRLSNIFCVFGLTLFAISIYGWIYYGINEKKDNSEICDVCYVDNVNFNSTKCSELCSRYKFRFYNKEYNYDHQRWICFLSIAGSLLSPTLCLVALFFSDHESHEERKPEIKKQEIKHSELEIIESKTPNSETSLV